MSTRFRVFRIAASAASAASSQPSRRRFFRSSRPWGKKETQITTLSTVALLSAVGIVQVSTSSTPSDDDHVAVPDPAQFPRIPPRKEQLAALRQPGNKFDVLIIGGGASGAGCALDAASRGLKVALVERDDFACGTSSRSTKLVHGGVRYLEKAFRVLHNC